MVFLPCFLQLARWQAARMLKKLQPEDLLKFGLIPEFIGRIPIYAVLDALDEATLQMILTKPKNAILKQYQCLLKMDGVEYKILSIKDALAVVE